jgi:adenine deaminase
MNSLEALRGLIEVAKGEEPADVLLKDARIINTFNGEIEQADVAVYQDRIAGVGNYNDGKEIRKLDGEYLAPGMINAHTHLESSMLHPFEYAREVVPRGVSAIVTDLHELANVAGKRGIKFVQKWSDKLPMDMFIMAPSCVPATEFETSGAKVSKKDIKDILEAPKSLGLGEVMNFPGILSGDKEVLEKLLIEGLQVKDGHAPELTGKELNAYISTGIRSEHEAITLSEAKEKLKRGMHIMIREGSTEKNLKALLPLVDENTYPRCMFITDDRTCADLLNEGEIDNIVRKAIELGLDPIRAIQLSTINPSEYLQLEDRGAIAPGYLANFFTFKDLQNLRSNMVFYKGDLVAKEGTPTFEEPSLPPALTDTFNVKPITKDDLKLKTGEVRNGTIQYPVINIVPGQIITEKSIETLPVSNHIIHPDGDRDILKLVVVERHHSTGNVGIGFVNGFKLEEGALASSIAHDSHNIICIGANDKSIMRAVEKVIELNGGLVASDNNRVLEALPLPIAGLLSPEPLESVVDNFTRLTDKAKKLGDLPMEPFALLSFLALAVIPELRLTDQGYVDLTKFEK